MKLSSNQLKYLKSLHDRKYRQKYHNFIAEGLKLANEVLASRSFIVETVVAVPEWLEQNTALLGNVESVIPVAENELKKISLLATPSQVFLIVKQPNVSMDEIPGMSGLSIFLDDVRDPGNLGTILRIADWFGIDWVCCSPGSVELWNPKVVQASMGAFLRVKCVEMEFDDLNTILPGVPIYGMMLDGDSLFSTKTKSPAVIVVGNESKGISAQIQLGLTHRISIPKGPGGGAESLNAAVATGIVCAFFTANAH